ncbi:hypothetical protein LINPERHAP1_LOCUS26781, partial [Linum perenne]
NNNSSSIKQQQQPLNKSSIIHLHHSFIIKQKQQQHQIRASFKLPSSIIHASSIINQLSHIITAAAYNHSKKQIITAYKLHINHPNKTTTLQRWP